MKKVIKKISLTGLFLMCLLQKYCFAIDTIAGDMLQKSRKIMKDAEPGESKANYLPIIIGIIVAIIIVIAIVVIVKNKKKKETKNEE